MPRNDTKQMFGGSKNKSRFGGEIAIKYGGGYKQTKDKGPPTGLEHVWFVSNQSNPKMLTQFSKETDAIATYFGKEFGGLTGPMAAQAIRTRQEPFDTLYSDIPEGCVLVGD